jgi:predicted DNA-binding transcriptional regulator AlpA
MHDRDEIKTQWVSARQLRKRYGDRSHMWVERRLKNDADFPRPIKIGRLRFWDLDQLEAYERSRVAA